MASSRRTRSALLAGAVTALALFTVPAHAGSSGAQLHDPAGDIAVPSLDVVSGSVRLDSTATGRTLTMTATMNGDLTGVPADYDLVTGIQRGFTCYAVATRLRWNGATLQQAFQHTSTFDCSGEVSPSLLTMMATETAQYAASGDPAEGHVTGRTVKAVVAAPAWLRPGTLAGFGVVSHTPVVGVMSDLGPATVGNFDMAALDRQWRVG
jgi:hypothetical protein